jgi:hypothetical protein
VTEQAGVTRQRIFSHEHRQNGIEIDDGQPREVIGRDVTAPTP